MERKGDRFMSIPVNSLFPGTKIHIGKKQYIVNDVVHLNGLVRVVYKTDIGFKTKSYAPEDQIKISLK